MNVLQVALTVVEHEGRKWLCLPGGNLVDLHKAEVDLVDFVEAKNAVHELLESRARWRRENELHNKWRVAINREAKKATGGTNKQSEEKDAWSRRLDGCRKSCERMVERKSNLKIRSGYKERTKTWEACINGAYRRAIQWNDLNPWDFYANNLASNLRQRIRGFDSRKASSQPSRGFTQEKRTQEDSRGSEVQMLFDWDRTDS
jgi:hypothetical protein